MQGLSVHISSDRSRALFRRALARVGVRPPIPRNNMDLWEIESGAKKQIEPDLSHLRSLGEI